MMRLQERKELLSGAGDEPGDLQCCICREGLVLSPHKVLGMYVMSSSGSPRRRFRCSSFCLTTRGTVIHLDCHLAASAAAAEARGRNARGEWESASLRNGNFPTNGLFPIFGPSTPPSIYEAALRNFGSLLGITDESNVWCEVLLSDVVAAIIAIAEGSVRGCGEESPPPLRVAARLLPHTLVAGAVRYQ